VRSTTLPDAPSVIPWLLLLYIGVSIPMFLLLLLSQDQTSHSYAVSRELLGFLQSPLPSLLIVYIPKLLNSPFPRFTFTMKRSSST
jgi:hypothetical protein